MNILVNAPARSIGDIRSLLARGRLGWLSLLLAVFTCEFRGAAPNSLIDSSWAFGLHAWASGAWGGVPVTYFTYGPLGFLSVPVVWGRTTYALAVLFTLVVQIALCRVVLARLVRLMPLPAALLATLAFVVLADKQVSELLLIVVGLATAELLESGVRRPRLALATGATLTGLAMLEKASTGVICLLLLVLVTMSLTGPSWPRRIMLGAGAGVAGLAVSFVAFSLLTRHPGSFPAWLKASQEIASGYTAMAIEGQGGARRSDYLWALPAVLLLPLVAAMFAARARDLRHLLPAVTVVLITYVAFREGFTRHDPGHMAVFASAALLMPLALGFRGRQRWALLPLVMAAIAFGIHVQVLLIHDKFDLAEHVRTLSNRVRLIADVSGIQNESRQQMIQDFDVPPDVLSALRGHRVQVDPWDTGVVWTYGLTWSPSAVWAMYSSYTPWLDDHNAASLSGVSAPDRILRRYSTSAIDGRNPTFESPAYQLQELCQWRQIVRGGRWQVLERWPDRCAAPRPLGRVRFSAGQVLTIPTPRTPGSVVTVRLLLDTGLRYALESAVFKPYGTLMVTTDGHPWRLVVDNAGQGLVLESPPGLPGLSDTFTPVSTKTLSASVSGTAVFEERTVNP